MRFYAGQSRVKGQFPHWDSHPTSSKITQPENSFSIRHANRSNCLLGPSVNKILSIINFKILVYIHVLFFNNKDTHIYISLFIYFFYTTSHSTFLWMKLEYFEINLSYHMYNIYIHFWTLNFNRGTRYQRYIFYSKLDTNQLFKIS